MTYYRSARQAASPYTDSSESEDSSLLLRTSIPHRALDPDVLCQQELASLYILFRLLVVGTTVVPLRLLGLISYLGRHIPHVRFSKIILSWCRIVPILDLVLLLNGALVSSLRFLRLSRRCREFDRLLSSPKPPDPQWIPATGRHTGRRTHEQSMTCYVYMVAVIRSRHGRPSDHAVGERARAPVHYI